MKIRMPFDRYSVRNTAWVCLLVFVFVVVDTQVAAAADANGAGASGGLLGPLNLTTSEGAPLDNYTLGSDPGIILNFGDNARSFLLGGVFAAVRMVCGMAGWLTEFVFTFPLLNLLLGPAQELSDTYNHLVVDTLGLKGLLLGWAFVFGLILFMRGKAARGLGEIMLTLLIAALAASALIRPDYLLGKDGPMNQVHQAAAEVAATTVNVYDFNTHGDKPCAGLPAAAALACDQRESAKTPAGGAPQAKDIAKPIQDVLTNALVVKPFMLLQYGRLLDPQKDAAAYAVHLRWVTGKYKPSYFRDSDKAKAALKPCEKLLDAGKDRCKQGVLEQLAKEEGTELSPSDVPGYEADDAPVTPEKVLGYISPEAREFQQFAKDLEKTGPTGKAAAEYARSSSWERVGAALLMLIAAVLIGALIGAMALVMLGTQGAELGAAATGGVAFVWGMLPGPSRVTVWKWVMVFMASTLLMFAVAAFLPAFGIAVDVMLTEGDALLLERLLLLDVLALLGLAFHRRLLASASGFADRLATRMRFAKVGGTHLPGDSSEIGAALATYASNSGGGSGGLLPMGGGFRAGLLGTRQKLMGRLAAMSDGTGMPINSGRVLADAGAEARRGLAPAMLAATGAAIAGRAAHGLLIGQRPDDEKLATWQKPTGPEGGEGPEGPHGPHGTGPHGTGPHGPGPHGGGAPLRVDKQTGEVLHDPSADRPLVGVRAHNRLVRFRGYRIARRAGIVGYQATYGLPATLNRAHQKRSELSEDVRQQLRVTGNQLREDGRQWEPVGQVINASATATRQAARDAAMTGVLLTGRTPTRDHEGTVRTPHSRPAQGTGRARQQVMDALINAQRSTWESQPPWSEPDTSADQKRVKDALLNARKAAAVTDPPWWHDDATPGGEHS
ncbi:hypothetical protein GCM10010329_82920 [Streptomyces spiroverticillatus]|uniref:Uncharacterized protein n=1 Tax=Streptomyces finlayi TaxID=67296 RepID=A0A918X8W9_9ACTN|nr:hypothetical protein [Streptomyces finlayi]GHA47909.1 hypothetical protein GCM10010329_82920 [Streptomyces spiroverticillatus]GHD18808.1 hypothetical protein GCM10010334_81980 [Streptomyces finlayi]